MSGGQNNSLRLYVQNEVFQHTIYGQNKIVHRKKKKSISCTRNCKFKTFN